MIDKIKKYIYIYIYKSIELIKVKASGIVLVLSTECNLAVW